MSPFCFLILRVIALTALMDFWNCLSSMRFVKQTIGIKSTRLNRELKGKIMLNTCIKA